MTALATRRPATPYARRLARERGFALERITGSGPDGRIVGADIEAFAHRPAPPLPNAATASSPATAAYAATIDLTRLQALLMEFGGAQLSVTLDALLLRAAAHALEALPPVGGEAGEVRIAWEIGSGAGRRLAVVADAQIGLVGGLHQRLVAAIEAALPNHTSSARLSLRRLEPAAIRAVSVPLLPGFAARLVISAGAVSGTGEALLSFDPDIVGEDEAAALLARFRDGLEQPVRLLA